MYQKLNINLHEILRARMSPRMRRLIPGVLITCLEKIIHQDELNDMLERTYPLEGSEFSQRVYDLMGLTIEVQGMEHLEEGKRYVFASNHPLGGLDGIGLIKILGERYGDDGIRFLVNDMLMNVVPLRNVFLPINKYGSQGREAAKSINAAFESERQMVVFPAGLVSRLHPDGEIKDLTWQKSFVQKGVASGRDFVPMYFEGLNRMRFYRLARWRKRLGIKVNLEQAMLPAELCAARGKRFGVIFGTPISHQEIERRMQRGESATEIAAWLREKSLQLRTRCKARK